MLLAMYTSGKMAIARGHRPLLWRSCTVPRLLRPLCLGMSRNMGHQQSHTCLERVPPTHITATCAFASLTLDPTACETVVMNKQDLK